MTQQFTKPAIESQWAKMPMRHPLSFRPRTDLPGTGLIPHRVSAAEPFLQKRTTRVGFCGGLQPPPLFAPPVNKPTF